LAFKKEMGLGQKVVKLKNGTKKEMKNYINNWAYFYICFSNIMNYLCSNVAPFLIKMEIKLLEFF